MATKKTRPTAQSTQDDQRRASLTSLLATIMRELNELSPPDVVTVPLTLSVPLAALLQDHIRTKNLQNHIADVHNYYLAHGFYHSCLEADQPQPHLAQQIARVILASAEPLTKARFLAHHPEAALPAAHHHKEPRA